MITVQKSQACHPGNQLNFGPHTGICKESGEQEDVTISSSLCWKSRATSDVVWNDRARGNAPKIAWMPIHSAVIAENKSPTSTHTAIRCGGVGFVVEVTQR